ncbi:NAD-dependent succinate-semialdehyde dehydrogenase [Tumidithrix helvetica PCC 7403]|uniref:NAD-dependent succinate-semialdehyde dehydrogenase n=1 Tax=Tumidithrix helvetica TaxID=3457545 RepID=UPI003C9B492C
MSIASTNPTTGEVVQTFIALTSSELDTKLALAERAFTTYRHISFAQKAGWMHKAVDILEARKLEFAKLMTLEMGKPLLSAIAEVEKSALVCRFYAENAEQFLGDVSIPTAASRSFVRYQPLGIILAVMPWNFPFWQVFRFAAPALMAGNIGLLKHASNVPQCALAIEEIFQAAGFPTGVFQTLLVGANRVAEIVKDGRVKAATLTGSEPAGQSLAAIAGHEIKKTVLELGGSDPFIVLKSANLEEAVSTAIAARMLNSGQSCIAAKRFIVEAAIAAEFEQRLVEGYKALKVGDPMLPETDIGPLATDRIRQELDLQVQKSVQHGAKLLIGGDMHIYSHTPLAKGNFYPPTILSDIPKGCPAYADELFGPVASLFRVADIDEAIALANCTPFGLGASAWTTDLQEQERLINDLEAGAVFINSMVKSDPKLPFGGIKRSGYGRELGIQGIQEFVNIKTVCVQ